MITSYLLGLSLLMGQTTAAPPPAPAPRIDPGPKVLTAVAAPALETPPAVPLDGWQAARIHLPHGPKGNLSHGPKEKS